MDDKQLKDQMVFVDSFGTGHVTKWYEDGSEETYFTNDYDEIYSIDPSEAEKLGWLMREDY